MKSYKEIEFQKIGDPSWQLIVAEGQKEVPFSIQRIFYMLGTQQGVVRGNHANRRSQFVLVCIKGKVRVIADDGKNKDEFVLDQPWKGLYLDKMVWKIMDEFSDDAVLLVISSEKFDPDEYIRSYEDFSHEVGDCPKDIPDDLAGILQ